MLRSTPRPAAGFPLALLVGEQQVARFQSCRDQLRDRGVAQVDAVSIAVVEDGDELGWHFDNSEFSVTVMYTESDAGGHFDYCPGLRDENYPGVQKALLGDPGAVVRLPTSPGTLAVFRGRHALHRVTPVSGPRPRINSVLTYGERPGMKLNRLTQELFYGRTG